MPEQNVDNVESPAAFLADAPALSTVANARFAVFAARGHEIITENMARARELARSYPAVGVLIPVIESTLRSLFAHLIADHDEPVPVLPTSRVESAAPVLERREAEIASDAPPAVAAAADLTAASDTTAPFPPVRDDKIPAPTE